MAQRVLFILAGVAIYGFLREYFELSRGLAALLAGAPLALAESRGLMPGPYEKSARDVMHESDDAQK